MPSSKSSLSPPNFVQHLLTNQPPTELSTVASTISILSLREHPEGGYFAETDRDTRMVPNPFRTPTSGGSSFFDQTTRHASTTIFYLLSHKSPVGHFHRNKARTVHTLHRGRGVYVILHADEVPENDPGAFARVETFVVGHSLANGEKLQWIVEGGKFKASFLLPDHADAGDSEGGLLISETVVPGFEFADHDFLTADLLEEQRAVEASWLLRAEERVVFRDIASRLGILDRMR